jgi:hypothetical protein
MRSLASPLEDASPATEAGPGAHPDPAKHNLLSAFAFFFDSMDGSQSHRNLSVIVGRGLAWWVVPFRLLSGVSLSRRRISEPDRGPSGIYETS